MSALTPELLARIRERAAGYDRDNAFFTEDLDELRAAGYLAPRSLLETARDQRLLAAHAPATALGINMHLVWVGVARVLAERGDASLDWVLQDAAAGELFAFGNSEPGNDLVLWDSLTTAERVDGGFAFTGTKIFTSLAPAWTRLGIFGKQTDGRGRAAAGARIPRARDAGDAARRRDDARRLGHARHARHPEQHDEARRRVRAPTTGSRASCRSARTPIRSSSRSSRTSCC